MAGGLTVSGVRKLEALKCVTGDVEIVDSAADNPVTASTYSGNITVRNLKARGIQLSSVAAIHLKDPEVNRLMVRTVQGDLEFPGEPSRRTAAAVRLAFR